MTVKCKCPPPPPPPIVYSILYSTTIQIHGSNYCVLNRHSCNPNNPVVILRFAILTSDSADRGRSIIRVIKAEVNHLNSYV